MTEEMAIESLVKSYWELKGYLVRTRVPYRVEEKGGIHDIDVLCFHPKEKRSMIIECKAGGTTEDYWGKYEKNDYMSLKKVLQIKKGKGKRKGNIFSTDSVRKAAIEKVKELVGIEPEKMIVYIPAEVDKELTKKFSAEMGLPVEFVGIHELIKNLFGEIALDMRRRRKRYPDTALELIRLFTRCYMADFIDLNDLGNTLKQNWEKYKEGD